MPNEQLKLVQELLEKGDNDKNHGDGPTGKGVVRFFKLAL
jgi:hypothetical protein